MADYDIAGVEGLDLRLFYRAMAWLGEELEEKPAGALAPRCVKDVIEEKLSSADMISSPISAVFMDTTSLSFYGAGGETLVSMATRRIIDLTQANDPGYGRRWFGFTICTESGPAIRRMSRPCCR